MKLKIFILFLLGINMIFNAQNSEMVANNNRYNYSFTVTPELIQEFQNHEDIESEVRLIAKYKDSDTISIYLQNNTSVQLTLPHEDERLFIIQEALDSNGLWKPIEYWSSSNCGNSYGEIEMASKAIIETKSHRYKGDFTTKIRFKLNYNYTSIYSNVLEGKVKHNQFILPEDSSSIWPLRIIQNMGKTMPKGLQNKVLFLHPNGMQEFHDYFEKLITEIKN